MNRSNYDSLSGIRTEGFKGVRFLSDQESSHYAALAKDHLMRLRSDIDLNQLLPIRAVELDHDEMLLEYARHHSGIPFYRGPKLFITMRSSGELCSIKTDWSSCRIQSEADPKKPPAILNVPEESSRLRGAYALNVSAIYPFYLYLPRMYDASGKPVLQNEKLGPWEWIDLRGAHTRKRNSSTQIRSLQGNFSLPESKKVEALEREELRKVRSTVLDYLLNTAKPRGYRWAFLAGKRRSSFRAIGGIVHVRLYRLVHGLPVLGGCLDLYIERRSGKVIAASDELEFRRMRAERFTEALVKPKLSSIEAWEKLRVHIRISPYYVVTGQDFNGVKIVSLHWIEESEYVCEASSGHLVHTEIIRL
ncbi:hypothetical protein [Saccharibacillus sp. JS10]|uniref:hypothetical protein n=1 Tax=Saccharibacillus sp. JS10 TaxID=2950552 RepID=UPI002109B360|nr:hypothetical protein [Saccharibacillus sp. JS10]MCQ4085513.1 hypothetical protein [Saccharibacillus sp. JS10]